MDDRTVWTDDQAGLIKAAREKGWATDRIVRTLMRGVSRPAEIKVFAEQYAALLGITAPEFIRMAGPRSAPRKAR
jgi:hypothetical protein